MTISLSQSGGARVVMTLARPRPALRLVDVDGAGILLMDLLDAVLDRR